MWSSTQQNGQISSWTVRIASISIGTWQSDPMLSRQKAGSRDADSSGVPGNGGGGWLGVVRGRHCRASCRALGSLGFRCHGGENRKTRQVDQSDKPRVNSEIYRDVTVNSTILPLLLRSVCDRHLGGDTATPTTIWFRRSPICVSDHGSFLLQCAGATHGAA